MLIQIQNALLTLQAIRKNPAIKTRASDGKIQLVEVSFNAAGNATIQEESEFMPADEFVAMGGNGFTVYRPGIFSIDCGPQFAGITDGRLWNGWACPFFTLETMKAIQEWVEDGINENPLLIEGGRVFQVYDNEEKFECEQVTIDGVIYYSIDGWCFDEDEEERTAC